MEKRRIDPVKELGALLLNVEKPARYVGGEYGRLAREDAGGEGLLKTLIAFPDLYEIGMSNQALRILYNGLNRIEGISCDRAFAPAPDFEALLRTRGLPLYGLDTGIPLSDTDILCVTLGYELGITGLLAMLDAAFIPIRAAERTDCHPLVIMGGPCVSNPLPYAEFIDAFWIGEAEAGFFSLAEELAGMKRTGAGKEDLRSRITAHPSVWVRGKEGAIRAVDSDFAFRDEDAAVFPVPNMKVVQHHGAVEIMRGCPNGCRFCHAGYWYRPMRQKSAETVRAEAAAFITRGGYREISLSSLSTGDYRHIDSLVRSLNRRHAASHISFQLPSLRISSFSLALPEEVSLVRKSGLTFAVETPVDAWQLSINKDVTRDHVAAILKEARERGWRGAKFYFMIGLPVGNYREGYENNNEEIEIVQFIRDIARRTGMHFNINAGVFVPKPHTPYQWTAQMNEETARKKLDYIRLNLKPLGHKVSVQDPFTSLLEGIISRGDEGVGEIVAEAFLAGCRLDAWTDYIKKDLWRALLEKHRNLVERILGTRDPGKELPWECIRSGIAPSFLKKEFNLSEREESLSVCMNYCTHPCGICNDRGEIVQNNIHDDIYREIDNEPRASGDDVQPDHGKGDDPEISKKDPATERILFSFSKQGRAVFQSHLALIEIFSMAFLRAGIPVDYSRGYNPLPRIEIVAPLAVGISASAEIALVDLEGFLDAQSFMEALNPRLPEGIRITEAMNARIPSGEKKYSLSSLFWGSAYRSPGGDEGQMDCVKFSDEKKYRSLRIAAEGSVFGIRRLSVLAKDPADENRCAPYFAVYRGLYPLLG